jgi:polysaccharide export outer membrane protein
MMSKEKIVNTVLVIVVLLSSFFSSCVSTKKITYFQFDQIDQENVSNSYQTTFKPDDLIQITIASDNREAVEPFNLVSPAANGLSAPQPYLIDSNGEIDFPILGRVKIGGLKREQALKLFRDKVSPDYVKNPTINIVIINFKITVNGDVGNPGTFTVPNERVSIIDDLGLAGDLNISARRDNILVLREEGGKKLAYRVNILSNKILTSPVFYLQQNDVIYVEHNRARIQSASSNANTGLYFSLIGLTITLITLLSR